MATTWEQNELAVTQTLARIEASLERLEVQVNELKEANAEQRGKASVTSLWISTVVAGAVTTAIKLIWHK
jgi:hypothetical protein